MAEEVEPGVYEGAGTGAWDGGLHRGCKAPGRGVGGRDQKLEGGWIGEGAMYLGYEAQGCIWGAWHRGLSQGCTAQGRRENKVA